MACVSSVRPSSPKSVVASDASYGMIRMLAVHTEGMGIKVQAFRELEAAREFLAA